MRPHLFPNFLGHVEEYRQARELWNDQWGKLIGQVGREHLWTTPWINTTVANGTPWLDGNPIFSAVCPSVRRGIRIIQQEPSGAEKELDFWTDTFAQGEGEEIKELNRRTQKGQCSPHAPREAPHAEREGYTFRLASTYLFISCALTAETLREAMDLLRQWITQPGQEPLTPAAKTSTPG